MERYKAADMPDAPIPCTSRRFDILQHQDSGFPRELFRQPGSPAVLGSFEGRSVASRMKRGPVAFHPRLSGGFGFIVVARDLSIVAGWQIGSRLPMSALGGDLKRSTQHFN